MLKWFSFFFNKKTVIVEQDLIVEYDCEYYLTKLKELLLQTNSNLRFDIEEYRIIIDKIKDQDFTTSNFRYYFQIIYGYYNQLITINNRNLSIEFPEIELEILDLTDSVCKRQKFVSIMTKSNGCEFTMLFSSLIINNELKQSKMLENLCSVIKDSQVKIEPILNNVELNRILDILNLLPIENIEFSSWLIVESLFKSLSYERYDETISSNIEKVIYILDKIKTKVQPNHSHFYKLASSAADDVFWAIYNYCRLYLNYTPTILKYKHLAVHASDLASMGDQIKLEDLLLYKQKQNSRWQKALLLSDNGRFVKSDTIQFLLIENNLPYNKNIYNIIIRYMCPKFVTFIKMIGLIQPNASEFESFLVKNKELIDNVLFSGREFNNNDMSPLIGIYSKKQLLKMYMTELSGWLVMDTRNMHDLILKFNEDPENESIKMPVSNKYKSLKEFHDTLVIISKQIRVKKHKVNQENISFLEEYNIKPNRKFNIKIPQTNYDLIDIGQLLSICVGYAGYAEKILCKKSNIIAIYSLSNELLYCIELDFKSHEIIQAKAQFNQPIPVDIKDQLLFLLQK